MTQVNTPVLSPEELEAAQQVEEAEKAEHAAERAVAKANKAALMRAVAEEAAEAEAVVAGEEKRQGCVRREQRVQIRERICEDNTVRSIMYPWMLIAMGHEARLYT